MSRVAGLLVALAGLAAAAGAQTPRGGVAETRARLARADSLVAGLARRDSLARQRTHGERLARRFDAGPLVVLLPAAVGSATGRRIVTGAAASLDGAVPAAFVWAHVVVAPAAAGLDSVLRAQRLAARAVIGADVAAKPDSFADGWVVAAAVATAYRATLDTTWRAWLPMVPPFGWRIARAGRGAVRELMSAEARTGAACLGGSVAACRLWLGLDDDPDPYRSRYTLAELRRQIESRWSGWGDELALVRQCQAGSDDACVRAAPRWINAVPAGDESRASLLAFVRTRGPDALAGALTDSSGSLGRRLALAAGMPEDSLVASWRSWLLTGGGMPRVTADVRDVLPVAFFAGLLLLAASRSGRWR